MMWHKLTFNLKKEVQVYFRKIATEKSGLYNLPRSISAKAQNIVLSWILNMLSGMKGQVLDLGCGPGRYVIPLCKRGFDVVGFDISKEMLHIIRRRSANYAEKEKTALAVGDVAFLPFKEKSFDVVLCLDLLHIIPSTDMREKVINEIARVTKTGGEVFIEIKNKFNPYFWFKYSERNPTPVSQPICPYEVLNSLKSNNFGSFGIKGIWSPIAIIAPIIVVESKLFH